MNWNSPANSIWMGYDSRMAIAFAVAKYSLRCFDKYTPLHGLVLDDLRQRGIYTRPIEKVFDPLTKITQMWDTISAAPMSTEFSISRFLVPHLARTGMALFCDSDVIFRAHPARLFEFANTGKALYCVKHNHKPISDLKMDGQIQTQYARKNWSSVMLFNCDHPANKKLTLQMINTFPGRDLHRFCWLKDDEIGELPPEWNYLVGHTRLEDRSPAIIHFTDGLPEMEGCEDQEYGKLWLDVRAQAVGAL